MKGIRRNSWIGFIIDSLLIHFVCLCIFFRTQKFCTSYSLALAIFDEFRLLNQFFSVVLSVVMW